VNRDKEVPLEWFACPVTKENLKLFDGDLVSPNGERYRRVAGTYWDLLPRKQPELQRAEWKTWEKLQANGVITYEADPEHNLGVGKRDDFLQFAEFCAFHGNVLDVGVGPQECPTHIKYSVSKTAFFVGVDPLVGIQPRCFAFVRALAEYLPFRSGVFSQVLFVTSLDHFIDARPALREAARVLASHGEICVWLGEKDKNAPKSEKTHAWYQRLKVPKGADDRFHFKRFTTQDFEGYLSEVGLAVAERSVRNVDPWRRNLFYRIRSHKPSNA
jgi:SAM-dependent methyltransferase